MVLKAFGVKSDDEVLVPSHTAFPTIEAICFAAAVPVFVDIDETYTVDVKDAAAKVSPRTVGFVPVHLYGQPANLDAVIELFTASVPPFSIASRAFRNRLRNTCCSLPGLPLILASTGSGYSVAIYILVCAIVSISATIFLPDYTNQDISQEEAYRAPEASRVLADAPASS